MIKVLHRDFLFFLSWLIFEKIGGWEPAVGVAKGINQEVDEWNEKYGQRKCDSCGSSNLVSGVTGGEGLLNWPHYFYRCRDCGNTQEKDRPSFLTAFKKLEEKRIIEDGKSYRYMILNPGQAAVTIVLLCFLLAAIIPFDVFYKIFTFPFDLLLRLQNIF